MLLVFQKKTYIIYRLTSVYSHVKFQPLHRGLTLLTGITALLLDVCKDQFIKTGGGGGKESEESRIIYTLARGVNNCKPLVKRDLEAFNRQYFKIYTVSQQTMHREVKREENTKLI